MSRLRSTGAPIAHVCSLQGAGRLGLSGRWGRAGRTMINVQYARQCKFPRSQEVMALLGREERSDLPCHVVIPASLSPRTWRVATRAISRGPNGDSQTRR